MNFLYPLGLSLSLVLPIIVMLHFKKQQVIEMKTSYIGLWDEIVQEIQGIRHNRINRYLLLFLQLLIGLLIIMALARPVMVKSFEGEKIIVALDCSMTMHAKEDGVARFDMAKEAIKRYLKEIDDNIPISFIALKGSSERLVKDGGKGDVIGILENLECTYEALNLEKAHEIINLSPGKSLIFSDKNLSLGDKQIKVGNEFVNIGIIYGSYDYYLNTALFRVRNYEKEDRTIVVSLEDEQGRRDIQKLDIGGNTIVDVSWPQVWLDSEILNMSILRDDILKEDNNFLLPIGTKFKYRILMVGEDYFLKRALLSIPYIEVEFKDEYGVEEDEYDLYIINSKSMEDQFPKAANIWNINPDGDLIKGRLDKYSRVEISDDNFAVDLNLQNIYIQDYPILKNHGEMQTVLRAEGEPVMAYIIGNNKKKMYSTIDWKKTNLPLHPSFPVLIENIVRWFLSYEKNWDEPGDYTHIVGDNLKLVTPSGLTIEDVTKPINLNEIGIYRIIRNSKAIRTFVVNPPKKIIEDHGDGNVSSIMFKDYSDTEPKTILDLKNVILMTLLILLVVEWEVYRRSV